MVEKKNACWVSVGKPEQKKPLGRPMHRQEKPAWRVWIGLIWLRTGTTGRLF
jgi:hypothetical protein